MAKKLTAYERKLQYNNTYNRENYRSFSIRYDKDSEKKIIKWLEKQPGVKSYLTGLILADMPKTEKKKTTAAKKKAAAGRKTKAAK